MVALDNHFAVKWETNRVIEVKNIKYSERTCTTAAKHKLYLKERHGMIHNLLIPDYYVHDILVIISTLTFTLLIFHLLLEEAQYTPAIVIATGAWGVFTV